MLSRAEVDKLLSMRAGDPGVLSLYLPVPLDPAALRSLPARADALLAAAVAAPAPAGRPAASGGPAGTGGTAVPEQDRQQVRVVLDQHGRDWLGHTMAIFTCGQLGLLEWSGLPYGVSERAVLADRPHVRPLLVALQRSPAYYAAVIDRRNAWVFGITAERIDTVAEIAGPGVRRHDFGGWYGLEAHRVNERIIQLARHHYRETAAILERAMRGGDQRPLVVGGHEESIPQFLAAAPADLRDQFAGSFAADPHTVTPDRVRDLAGPVIRRWLDASEQRLADQLRAEPPGGLAATGMAACLAAVNSSAVQILLVPDDGLVPGLRCGRCGTLSTAAGSCPDPVTDVRAIPDLIEEMAARTIADGGQVEAVRDPPAGIAARLRFPPVPGDKR